MLLAEFIGRAHVQIDDDRQEPVDLHKVRAFVFGEYYLIAMRNGKSYDVRDLETILAIMHDEFALWRNQWMPSVEIVSGAKLKGQERRLEVKAEQPGSFLPPPPVPSVVASVRRAVTMFNLTGSWDQFNRSNL
jgi:hypothetical protein